MSITHKFTAMATQLKKILRTTVGIGNPENGDRLVTQVGTFRVNTLYINQADGSVWIRKAVNGVAADFETMEVGSGGGGESYLVYIARLYQFDLNAPQAEVVKNTIGDIVWTKVDVGSYRATLAGAFPVGKTVCPPFAIGQDNIFLPLAGNTGPFKFAYTVYRFNDNQVGLELYDDVFEIKDLQETLRQELLVEIRVYP
jgi:hypothetical protein